MGKKSKPIVLNVLAKMLAGMRAATHLMPDGDSVKPSVNVGVLMTPPSDQDGRAKDAGADAPISHIPPGKEVSFVALADSTVPILNPFPTLQGEKTVTPGRDAAASSRIHVRAAKVKEDVVSNPKTSGKSGVHYYSERGDRLIHLTSFRDQLWQKFNAVYPQLSSIGSEAELYDAKETIQQLLRWGRENNKNVEEQAAQLHMLTAWSQLVEIAASRRISSLGDQSELLYQILIAALTASASPDCSLKMAFLLCQVALTCMAKLRDERFLFPGGFTSDNRASLDIIMGKQLPNSILFRLIAATLRQESSEVLRRRQYALLLSYFQYCQHMLDPDIPSTVLQFLLLDEQEGDDLDLQKINQEQAELARANFSILRKEAQSILDLVIKDATHGSELGKTISLYVLDAWICVDHERFFLSQLQSRGFLRSCLTNISSSSYQDGVHSRGTMQRAQTLEAELALLLRISHKYGKSGAQVIFSMEALDHMASCKAVNFFGSSRWVDTKNHRDVSMDINKQRMIVTPILRLVFSLLSLVDSSEFYEVKNKVVREVIDFVKGHRSLFGHVLREDVSQADGLVMEQINLVVGILSKVWPYEENDESGFVPGLFCLMHALFSRDWETLSSSQSVRSVENRQTELNSFRICLSLSSYLYFLVLKKSFRLQVSDMPPDYNAAVSLQQPTLSLLGSFLASLTNTLERAAEEKSLLLNRIRDINEVSRQEVDEIINVYARQVFVSSSDNIQKRRYIAMVEMCHFVGNRDQLITILLPVVEHVLHIFISHFQDSSLADPPRSFKTITYGATSSPAQDTSLLYGNLISTLERLEILSEDKIGHNLKVFRRLVISLKEITIQKLSS